MTLDPFTLAGIAGTALIIVAYFGNQQGWLKSGDWPFPLANLIGRSDRCRWSRRGTSLALVEVLGGDQRLWVDQSARLWKRG
jgi:hypothetical protein